MGNVPESIGLGHMQLSKYLDSIKLRAKLVLCMCVLAFVIASAVGWYNYFRISHIAVNTVIYSIADQTRLAASQLRGVFSQMENDAFVVSQIIPVENMAQRADHHDHAINNKAADQRWKEQLRKIFTSIMNARPHYAQMRFIGIDDNGRELVRVNRTPNGMETVPTAKLQTKGNEPYFKNALKHEKGRVYFSRVTFNRENNKVEMPLTPMIRSVLTVYDKNDNPLGMIVINANYEKLLSKTLHRLAVGHETIILNQDGDYLTWKTDHTSATFEKYGNYCAVPPTFLDKVRTSPKDEATFIDKEKISHFVRLNVSWNDPNVFLGVVQRLPKDELLHDTYVLRIQTLFLTLALILVTLVVTAFVARRLTKPLTDMTQNILKAKDYRLSLHLPLNKTDEIGDLARAFQQMADSLVEEEAKSRAVLDNANDGILTMNKHGIIESYNRACRHIFGYKSSEVVGKHISTLLPAVCQADDESFLANITDNFDVDPGENWPELEALHKSGKTLPIELSISEIKVPGKRLFSGIVRDISLRKIDEAERDQLIVSLSEVNEALERIAYYDPLTGLSNRASCQRDLQVKFGKPDPDNKFALLQIDLDNFKRVNDTLGHSAGDKLLKVLGDRLNLMQEDYHNFTPYRWGGDEFVAIIDLYKNFDLDAFCQELSDVISVSVQIGSATLNPTASLGIARFPDDAESLEDLMIFADLALYKTKDLGRDGYQLFDAEMKDKVDREARIEAELRVGIDEKQFEIYYQPQVDITTGKITGLETLVRWNHPEKGIISPGEFLLVSENTGLGPALGRYIIDEVMASASEFNEEDIDFGKLAINLSPQHLKRGTFLDDFFASIEKHKISPSQIAVEILESYIIDDPNMDITQIISTLRDRGIFVELDDFGTGYASLSHLSSLPISGLKIDQSFVYQMGENAKQTDIVTALISMAKAMGLSIVCEGVQSKKQIAILRQFKNCSIQGYFVAKPMPKKDIKHWISDWSDSETLKHIVKEGGLRNAG